MSETPTPVKSLKIRMSIPVCSIETLLILWNGYSLHFIIIIRSAYTLSVSALSSLSCMGHSKMQDFCEVVH